MTVPIGSLSLRNPVLTASGTFGYGQEYASLLDLGSIGGVVTKGISLEPRQGTAQPRIWETPAGMLNAIGLENVGLEAFESEKLPFLRTADCGVIVNYFSTTIDGYADLAERLGAMAGVEALEANISCPNVKAGGMEFGVDPEAAAAVTAASRARTKIPLIVKLSPVVSDVGAMARAVADAGADAITVANSFPGMAIDVERRRPRLSFGRGGLTGPAILPMVVRLVHDAAKAVEIPVIASGGISRWQDAAELILAGATAVEVGTANFRNPLAAKEVAEGLEQWANRQGVDSILSLVGALET